MRSTIGGIRLSPAQILISLDRACGTGLAGRLYSGFYHKAYAFGSETELLLGIDGLCDSMQFPQASFKIRSFETKYTKIVFRKAENFMDSELEPAQKEDRATFLVHIKFRQNATWQGSITWVEKEKTQNFRSALEMLKLMDEARHPAVREAVEWEDAPER